MSFWPSKWPKNLTSSAQHLGVPDLFDFMNFCVWPLKIPQKPFEKFLLGTFLLSAFESRFRLFELSLFLLNICVKQCYFFFLKKIGVFRAGLCQRPADPAGHPGHQRGCARNRPSYLIEEKIISGKLACVIKIWAILRSTLRKMCACFDLGRDSANKIGSVTGLDLIAQSAYVTDFFIWANLQQKKAFPAKNRQFFYSNSLRTSLASLPLVSGRNAADTADMHRETPP